MSVDAKKVITVRYTNYKGETGMRSIVPEKIWFGSTEWHKDEQWLLDAYDIDKAAIRNFALKDISEWKGKIV